MTFNNIENNSSFNNDKIWINPICSMNIGDDKSSSIGSEINFISLNQHQQHLNHCLNDINFVK